MSTEYNNHDRRIYASGDEDGKVSISLPSDVWITPAEARDFGRALLAIANEIDPPKQESRQ